MMGAVPYAYLAVTVVGLLAVALTFVPIRRDPLTTISFMVGWPCGELPLHVIAVEVVATVIFGLFGAFSAWPGWLGLALAVVGWCGLVVLAVVGYRARRVVEDALGATTGGLAVPTELPAPTWGRWWRLARAVPLRTRDIVIDRDLDYWGDGAPRHRLDVHRRAGVVGTGAPVLIYVHGGAWVMGEKKDQGRPMIFELVARGWVCVSVNYRLSPSATWPDHVVDVKRSVAWVKAHIAEYGGDPSFVVLSGGSAGGHLSALAALTPDDAELQPGFEDADTSVAACVPFYGVYDMTADPKTSGLYGRSLAHILEERVMKCRIDEHRDVFVRASPTFRVTRRAPPFFVLHGRNDTLVPVVVARRFVAALRADGDAPVAYAELPLAQHAFDVLASLRCQAATAGVAAFLEALVAGRTGPVAGEAVDAVEPGGEGSSVRG